MADDGQNHLQRFRGEGQVDSEMANAKSLLAGKMRATSGPIRSAIKSGGNADLYSKATKVPRSDSE